MIMTMDAAIHTLWNSENIAVKSVSLFANMNLFARHPGNISVIIANRVTIDMTAENNAVRTGAMAISNVGKKTINLKT